MEAKNFKVFGKEMVDYISDYLENIRDRYAYIYMMSINGPRKGEKLL